MIRGVIEYTKSPELVGREFNRLVADANAAAVEEWRATYVPRHFQPQAASLYAYQPRAGEGTPQFVPANVARKGRREQIRMLPSKRYYWRKFRKTGSTTPLVYSGASRQAAISGPYKVTSSSRTGALTFLGLPPYWFKYLIGQPRKDQELTSITTDEVQSLAQVHQRTLVDAMNKLRESKTETIG